MGLDGKQARSSQARPRCSVCGRYGCRGHEPFERCSELVGPDGVLTIDLRGEDRPDAGHVREGGQDRT